MPLSSLRDLCHLRMKQRYRDRDVLWERDSTDDADYAEEKKRKKESGEELEVRNHRREPHLQTGQPTGGFSQAGQ